MDKAPAHKCVCVCAHSLYFMHMHQGESFHRPAPCIACRLVMITLLQHTHPNLPHYDDKEWDWLRGALATVDRRCAYARVCVCMCACVRTFLCARLCAVMGELVCGWTSGMCVPHTCVCAFCG